ncbi:MAG: hypothetical protein RBR59_08765 [Sulfurimonadaceae bacterium]|jgi:hypothetical protein|nr:hypothetical protein [Sulfurimonadaceae bacterium]
MYIKRYAITALLFILFIGWYVYAYVTQESMSLNFLWIELPSLSIALWVVTPIIFLTLATIFHMFFYSFLSNLKLRKSVKDYEKFIDALVSSFLGKDTQFVKYKTPKFQLLGTLVANTQLIPSEQLASLIKDKKIQNVLELIKKVQQGEVVDLKKYDLKSTNPLMMQNQLNRYKKGEINCEKILTSPAKYNKELAAIAYIDYVKNAPLYAIEKYKEYLTKDALFQILARVNANEKILEISNESLLSLILILPLSTKEYIEISSALAANMLPEQRMKLFEKLSEKKEEAMEAYLFTLFDLEMLAPANDILDNSQSHEFLKYKSYRALKECNKHFNINLFI